MTAPVVNGPSDMGPSVKGWCPSAYRPMMSGDGLLVRVKPPMGHLTAVQIIGLCDLSDTFGNGTIDLTSRANLQIRGVTEDRYSAVLKGLVDLELVDEAPEVEARKSITVSPSAKLDGLTGRLYSLLLAVLQDCPELPDKMGIALDTGPAPLLQDVSADFRFERGRTVPLILRADTAATGIAVTEATAASELQAMMEWFTATGGRETGRMKRHLASVDLPDRWQGDAPLAADRRPEPGPTSFGHFYGAPFGQLRSSALRNLITDGHVASVRVTPWRMILNEDPQGVMPGDFVTTSGNALMATSACPGRPACAQALGETRDLAKEIAPHFDGSTHLHVSGCAKGCARPRGSDWTVVATNDGFDLVKNGAPWDEPIARGLSRAQLLTKLGGRHAL